MVVKIMKKIRFYILKFLKPTWIRFLLIGGYLITLHIIAVWGTTGELTIDLLYGIGISFICFMVTTGVVTLVTYTISMERELPILNWSFLLKPGRYYRSFSRSIKERHDSPVHDFDEMCFFMFIVFLISLVPLFQNIQNHNLHEAQSILYIQTCILSAFFTLIVKIPDYEKEYDENLKKAKKIFIECNGNRALLEQSEEYYQYQVDWDTEKKWYEELKMKNYEWIRPYEEDDLPYLIQLFYDTVHRVNAKDYTKEQLDAWADGHVNESIWNEHLLQNNTLVYVRNGEIIGFADMEVGGYLDHLFVHKNHQHEGIATKLCDQLEKQSDAKLFSTHASITAKPFFQNRGYYVVKKQQVERKGVLLTNYIMQKENPKKEGEKIL